MTQRSVASPEVLQRLEARLAAVKPDSQRRWGTLSPGEMLCHLADACSSVLSRPGGAPGPRRPVRKWLALRSGLRWPHGLPTFARIDPRRDGTPAGDFEQDRQRAIATLKAVAAAAPEALPAGHAIFGTMTAEDWYRWAYAHTDHHLRQFGV